MLYHILNDTVYRCKQTERTKQTLSNFRYIRNEFFKLIFLELKPCMKKNLFNISDFILSQ